MFTNVEQSDGDRGSIDQKQVKETIVVFILLNSITVEESAAALYSEQCTVYTTYRIFYILHFYMVL